MTPGPIEEVGKVAGTFMQIMKDQPLSLALVIMNLSLILLFWIIMDKVGSMRTHDMDMLYEEHKEVRELLSRCVVTPPAPR